MDNESMPNYDTAIDGTRVIALDKYLHPFADPLRRRFAAYEAMKARILASDGSLDAFTRGYEKFGLLRVNGGVAYREWAPTALSVSLVGTFNSWNCDTHQCDKDEYGVFHLFIEDLPGGLCAIPHGSIVKASVVTSSGERVTRIPAWIHRAEQDFRGVAYHGVFWNPPFPYVWKQKRMVQRPVSGLKIYEAHVGMASEEGKVASFAEFTANILPRIAETGFNSVQLMAIAEHVYYGSFGYHVTNFFSVSSRFGTPEDFKALVDRAHQLGIAVLIDVVHSHSSPNVGDGLNQWDGSDHHYFHDGPRGHHTLWGSRLFNYSSFEVLRFLLSNLRYWVEEYGIDGFRFDGVTSMLYSHHGIDVGFSGNYNEYFGGAEDIEACVYLMLANDVLHSVRSEGNQNTTISIAEDVSGMPALCRPVPDGGLGFNYRLGMAIPDLFIKMLKEQGDASWNLGHLVHTLENRRYLESTIAYCESHDQALVGDKTMAFWLMDKNMYTEMTVLSPLSVVVDRGIALHKMFRLITYAIGGEGYLTFMGNEFGHPEWIDFPREGNNDSFKHCRRQWRLCDDALLRYRHLYLFEKAMHSLEKQYQWLSVGPGYAHLCHESDKVIVFSRSNLLFVFNFHQSQSFTDYKVPVPWAGKFIIALDSDHAVFGGHQRVAANSTYFSVPEDCSGCPQYMLMYLPCRSVIVLTKVD